MSRGLVIAGGLALGGGVLWLATRERAAVMDAPEAAPQTLFEVVRPAYKATTSFVRQAMSGVSGATIARIKQYDLINIIERWRGAVPFGVAAAMAEHESNFDPTVYNWYVYKSDQPGPDHVQLKKNGKPYLGAPNGHAGEGGPWAGGLIAHDPHAIGLYQILDVLRKSYPKADGTTPTTAELFDPNINAQCALRQRSDEAKRLAPYAGGDMALLAALIYMAHAEGLGKLVGGKYPGAFSKLKALGKPVTWANICALPWGASGWWALGNRLSGIAQTAARAAIWEAALAQLKAGATAQVGAEAVVVVPPDAVTALLMAAQAAEIERDLQLAAQLRAELAALNAGAGEGIA